MGRFGAGRVKPPKRGGGGGSATPPPTTQLPLFTGAYIKGSNYNASWADSPFDLQGYGGGPNTTPTFEANAGKGISILHWGQQWRSNGVMQPFYSGDHQKVRDHGSIPMLDWTPWDLSTGTGTSQPEFTMSTINAGTWDTYIDSWATGAALWGKPLFVRPMWEMNGVGWFPWQPGTNGTTTTNYVAAWRRIVTRARAAGALNISWVWCPNINSVGTYPMTGLYPGDDVVDWVALDGYCKAGATNVTFANLFSASYNEVYTLASTSKPMMLGEWGCDDFTNVVGTKAQWYTDAFNTIKAGTFPRLRGIVYFNWDTGAGNMWRIETGTGAQAAYAAGISNSVFKANSYSTYSVAGAIPPPT